MYRRAKYIFCTILVVMLLAFQAQSVLALCCINDHRNTAGTGFVFHHHYTVSPNAPLCENFVGGSATCVKEAPRNCNQDSSAAVAAASPQKWSQDTYAIPVSSPAPFTRSSLNAEEIARIPENIPTATVYLFNLTILC